MNNKRLSINKNWDISTNKLINLFQDINGNYNIVIYDSNDNIIGKYSKRRYIDKSLYNMDVILLYHDHTKKTVSVFQA